MYHRAVSAIVSLNEAALAHLYVILLALAGLAKCQVVGLGCP